MKRLTKREKQFAALYVHIRNARETAAAMGLRDPAKQGEKMLANEQVMAAIRSLAQKSAVQGEAASGLRRIAFGSVADAVRLMLEGGENLNLDALDLFCVSEIKMPKGGGMEIKFFDRIKALERLSALNEPTAGAVNPFVEALQKGADRLRPDFDEENLS